MTTAILLSRLARLGGEVEFWHALFALAFMVSVMVLLLPALAEWLARWLHAHAIASSAAYKVVAAAGRAYRRVHDRVMEETA